MGGSKTAILAQVVHFYSDGWVTLQSAATLSGGRDQLAAAGSR